MAASDLSSVAYIYKRLYSEKAVGDLAMRDHPLFKMTNKEGGFTGTAYFYAIRYGNPQGVSGTFAGAQSGAASSKGVQLQASRKPKFGLITLNGEAMAAADGDKGAFLELVTQETDGVIEEMGDSFAFDFYRDGTGQRGRRASASTNVITLTANDDVRNFKVGATVIASANADGSSPRVGSTTVAGLNEDGTTITLTSAAGITSFADNDYLFRLGDPGTCMEGLSLHLPLTAPAGGDSFRGIDRSVDARRLAGVRINDTATSIEENVGLGAVKISQIGKKADKVTVNPIRFWEVARRLNAKVEYDGGGGKADFGFEYVSIHSPAGTIKMYADPDCPTNRFYVMNQGTWYLKHLKGLPHIIEDDGRPNLRMTTEDAIEARARGWVNLVCTQPGSNCVGAI